MTSYSTPQIYNPYIIADDTGPYAFPFVFYLENPYLATVAITCDSCACVHYLSQQPISVRVIVCT